MRRAVAALTILLLTAALSSVSSTPAASQEDTRPPEAESPPGLPNRPDGIPPDVWDEAEKALRQPNVAVVITSEGVEVLEVEDIDGRLPTAPVPDRKPEPLPLEPPEPEFRLDPGALREPLSEHELQVREMLGFAIVDPSSAFSNVEAASSAFAVTGARMTAEEWAEVARRSSLGGRVFSELEHLLDDPSYVDVRIVQKEGGVLQIAIARDGAPGLRRKIDQALHGIQDPVELVEVDYSRGDYEAAVAQLREVGRAAKASGRDRVAELVAEAPWSFDAWRGVLRLGASEELPADFVEDLRKAVPVPLEIELLATGSDACGQYVCDQHFRGGLRITLDTPTENPNCSNAATIQRNANEAYVLTSGHCAEPDWDTGHDQIVMMDGSPGQGYPVSWVLANWDTAGDNAHPNDIAYYPISHWAASNRVYLTGQLPSQEITGAATAWDLLPGQFGCVAGANSNVSRCSTIQTQWSSGLFIWNHNKAQQGDSGGAWLSASNVFLGMHIGSVKPRDTDGRDIMIGWPQLNANMGYGWNVVTRDAWTDQLSNNSFASGSPSSPTGWNYRATTNAGRSSQAHGYADNYELFSICPSGSQCSWYQDTSSPLYAYKNYGASVFARCRTGNTCILDLALWGLGGGSSTGKSVRATIPAWGEAYVATTFQFTTNRDWVRFEAYNSIPGRSLWFSDPLFVPFW